MIFYSRKKGDSTVERRIDSWKKVVCIVREKIHLNFDLVMYDQSFRNLGLWKIVFTVLLTPVARIDKTKANGVIIILKEFSRIL
jgi:hypothetical protein